MNNSLFLIVGSHLFSVDLLSQFKEYQFVMIEDYKLCTHYKYHKQKIAFFLESMRNYRDLLKKNNFKLRYFELDKKNFFFELLALEIKSKNINELISFTIENKFFRNKILSFCNEMNIIWTTIENPMFLNGQLEIASKLSNKKPLMRIFYEQERVEKNILLTIDRRPIGGKFSFDEENRKKLPKNINIPSIFMPKLGPNRQDVVKIIEKYFFDHPGCISEYWLPTDHEQASLAFKKFLNERLLYFGHYEDAIDETRVFLFHSTISPLLNCGLLRPKEVIEEALSYRDEVPLNSLEGFIRQIIGWREFIRGIYENFSEKQENSNFFNNTKKFTQSWYEGTTGILPLDQAIKKTIKYGYCHHIERLMVLSNCMLLAEISPQEVHRWFMEMFVDSAEWVMGPNVFGMGQFSDGGLFSTKPYICGSNYILKMSNLKKGDWCDTIDGLFWRFIQKHADFFVKQARMSMMVKQLERMNRDKKKYIIKKADEFISTFTT